MPKIYEFFMCSSELIYGCFGDIEADELFCRCGVQLVGCATFRRASLLQIRFAGASKAAETTVLAAAFGRLPLDLLLLLALRARR